MFQFVPRVPSADATNEWIWAGRSILGDCNPLNGSMLIHFRIHRSPQMQRNKNTRLIWQLGSPHTRTAVQLVCEPFCPSPMHNARPFSKYVRASVCAEQIELII